MRQYSSLNTGLLRGLSIVNILLSIFSCIIQSVILTGYCIDEFKNSTGELDFEDGFDRFDLVGSGLWAGLLYCVGGLVGICASYEHKHSQLIAATVFTSFSVCGGIVCAVMSGIKAVHHTEYDLKILGAFGTGMQYSLMGVSIGAAVVNITSLFYTLKGLCGRQNRNGLVRLRLSNA